MCNCPKCKEIRETKLTPEQVMLMKKGIDALFEGMLPRLPASIAVCVHATMQTSIAALAPDAPPGWEIGTDAQLRALAVVYGAYWMLADAGLREEAVLYLREKLKAATPKLMEDVRVALARTAPVVVAVMEEIGPTPTPVDRTKLN